jgi:hypothetical protein
LNDFQLFKNVSAVQRHLFDYISEKLVAVYKTNMNSGCIVRLEVSVSLLKISFNTKKNGSDRTYTECPVFVSLITAAITGGSGGCGLTLR